MKPEIPNLHLFMRDGCGCMDYFVYSCALVPRVGCLTLYIARALLCDKRKEIQKTNITKKKGMKPEISVFRKVENIGPVAFSFSLTFSLAFSCRISASSFLLPFCGNETRNKRIPEMPQKGNRNDDAEMRQEKAREKVRDSSHAGPVCSSRLLLPMGCLYRSPQVFVNMLLARIVFRKCRKKATGMMMLKCDRKKQEKK
jgi:hypothetical protein